jgi:hypothetical protein
MPYKMTSTVHLLTAMWLSRCRYAADAACPCSCPAHYPGTPEDVGAVPSIFPDPSHGASKHAYAIEDTLVVPADIPPGDYILGFRWDCEQTTQ